MWNKPLFICASPLKKIKRRLSGLETVYFHFRTKDKGDWGLFLALQFLSLPLPFLIGSDSLAINLCILSMKTNFWNLSRLCHNRKNGNSIHLLLKVKNYLKQPLGLPFLTHDGPVNWRVGSRLGPELWELHLGKCHWPLLILKFRSHKCFSSKPF